MRSRNSNWVCAEQSVCLSGTKTQCEDGKTICYQDLTGFIFDPVECIQYRKEAKLYVNISSTDTQWSTKVYYNGDEINYKVTI